MRTDRVVVARVRRAAGADGAAESGLTALLWAHALHSAGDALVTVALAGTVFLDVPLGQARDRVALYLLLTLLPFSLLVPVAGPLLDRVPHGRRNVLAATTACRGLLAWSMAGLLASLTLYPLALGVLVLSRAYGVARSAATPRVTPEGMSLVTANARLNVAAVSSAAVAAAVGAGIATLVGGDWVLRLASPVLLAAAFAAVRLPAQIDDERAERRAVRSRYRLLDAPQVVLRPLVTAVALRGLAGLLTIFLAFDLRAQGASTRVIGLVLGAAFAGQLLGTAAASRLPERILRWFLLAALALPALGCAVAALLDTSGSAAAAAGLTGLSYALGKFALDASLQTHVPAHSVSGAFARSETGLQLTWAVGGGIGLALPPVTSAGFAVAAAVPLLGLVASERVRRGLTVLPGRHRPAGDQGSGDAVPDGPPAPDQLGRDQPDQAAPEQRQDSAAVRPGDPLRVPVQPRPWWLEDDD